MQLRATVILPVGRLVVVRDITRIDSRAAGTEGGTQLVGESSTLW